jgi:hypothetical protein
VTAMARPRQTLARANIDTPYARESRDAATRTMAREARCPETFAARLAWLARVWADEPMPEAIHGAGVWTGPQHFDRRGDPKSWPSPDGVPEWPDELVGGSAIGSPRIIEPFRRYIEGARTALDIDGSYCRPLAAALAKLDRGGCRRPPHPKGARLIWGTCTSRGDWQRVAASRGVGIFEADIARAYLRDMLGLLWEWYLPRPRRED